MAIEQQQRFLLFYFCSDLSHVFSHHTPVAGQKLRIYKPPKKKKEVGFETCLIRNDQKYMKVEWTFRSNVFVKLCCNILHSTIHTHIHTLLADTSKVPAVHCQRHLHTKAFIFGDNPGFRI